MVFNWVDDDMFTNSLRARSRLVIKPGLEGQAVSTFKQSKVQFPFVGRFSLERSASNLIQKLLAVNVRVYVTEVAP